MKLFFYCKRQLEMYMSTRGLKLPLHSGYSKNVYSVFYMLVIHCVSCVVLENKLTKGSKLMAFLSSGIIKA